MIGLAHVTGSNETPTPTLSEQFRDGRPWRLWSAAYWEVLGLLSGPNPSPSPPEYIVSIEGAGAPGGIGFLSVCVGNSKIVAVGGSLCWTAPAPHGGDWSARSIPAGTYRAVTWNGTTFCAVGDSVCATSPDGVTWTARTIPAGTYYAITSLGGSTLWAVGNGVAARSTNAGTTWTVVAVPAAIWRSVAWNGAVACAVDGAGQFLTTTDGATVSSHSSMFGARSIASHGSSFCALSTLTAGFSSDGMTWSMWDLPAVVSGKTFPSVVRGGAGWFAVSSDGTSGVVFGDNVWEAVGSPQADTSVLWWTVIPPVYSLWIPHSRSTELTSIQALAFTGSRLVAATSGLECGIAASAIMPPVLWGSGTGWAAT